MSVRQYDEGHGERHYGHCIVAGIDQYPLKISKSMEKKKIDKRSKLKPFLKVVNYNHVMPTRSVSPPPLSLLSKPAGSARVRDESRRALALSGLMWNKQHFRESGLGSRFVGCAASLQA